MRRKPVPSPIVRPSAVRALRPALSFAALPTAAALAVALASAACSAPTDGIAPDPIVMKQSAVSPIPSTSAPAAPSASGLGLLDPEPVALPGEPAIVVPTPSATTAPLATTPHGTPKHPPIAPSSKPPKLGGKPMPPSALPI